MRSVIPREIPNVIHLMLIALLISVLPQLSLASGGDEVIQIEKPDTGPIEVTPDNTLTNYAPSIGGGGEGGSYSQLQGCYSAAKTAKLACSTLSALTGMGPTESALVGAALNSQLPALITQLAGANKSAAEQCRLQADINKIVTLVSAAKAGACAMLMGKCKSTCSSEVEAVAPTDPSYGGIKADGNAKRNTCGQYSVNMGMMLAQAGLGLINTLKANQCSDALTSATATPISLVESNVDCSNSAYASTNMVCICRNTPTDPMCAGLSNNGGYNNGAGGIGSGSVTTPTGSSDDLGEGNVAAEPPGFKGESGSNGMSAGGGGGGLPGGGGAGALPGSEGEGAAGSGLDKNVITGTSGGGGGISPLTAGGGGGGGSKGGGSGGGGGGSDFDLKKYLPKSLFKGRGLAGMTVPSTDGVTGPMGPSLWEKVTNRYQVKKPTLIQDK